MAIEVFNRTEIKYQMPAEVSEKLMKRLSPYVDADAYSKDGGTYLICNIYYDTPENELIRRSLDKPLYKEKLRLRSYGTRSLEDKVFLEVKKKYEGVVNKRRTKIRLGDAYRFIENGQFTNADGSTELPDFMNAQVTKELAYFINSYPGLAPALYLSYERQAFFAKDDPEIRITFDRNITTRRYDLGLHYGNYGDKLIPDDMRVMEVKVAQSIPLWLTDALSEYKIYPKSFSKYGSEYRGFIQNSQKNEKTPEVQKCSNQ